MRLGKSPSTFFYAKMSRTEAARVKFRNSSHLTPISPSIPGHKLNLFYIRDVKANLGAYLHGKSMSIASQRTKEARDGGSNSPSHQHPALDRFGLRGEGYIFGWKSNRFKNVEFGLCFFWLAVSDGEI